MDHRRMAVAHCCNASNAEPKLNNLCVRIINCYFSFEQILCQIQGIFSEKRDIIPSCRATVTKTVKIAITNNSQRAMSSGKFKRGMFWFNWIKLKWNDTNFPLKLHWTQPQISCFWTELSGKCFAELKLIFFTELWQCETKKKIGKRKVPRSSVQHINSKHLSV